MVRTRLKICCMASPEEARLAVAYGADAVGLVGPMPSGAGTIDEATAARIAPVVPPPIATFFLTSRDTAAGIAEHMRMVRADTVQIVRHIDPGQYAALRGLLPATKIVQVVHVEDDAAIALAAVYARLADALLLDSGRPGAATAELGGTGRVHDWTLSRTIVEQSPIPVFLAGGLNAGNVRDAVAAVAPYGVDLCSGVRTDGRLDETKLAAFVAALWGRGRA